MSHDFDHKDLARAGQRVLDPILDKHGWSFDREATTDQESYRQYSKDGLFIRLLLRNDTSDPHTAFVFLWKGESNGGRPLDLAFYVDQKKRKAVFEALDTSDKSLDQFLTDVGAVIEGNLKPFLAGDVSQMERRLSEYDDVLDIAKRRHARAPKISKALMYAAIVLALLSLTLIFVELGGR
jgi:hypothetical protein